MEEIWSPDRARTPLLDNSRSEIDPVEDIGIRRSRSTRPSFELPEGRPAIQQLSGKLLFKLQNQLGRGAPFSEEPLPVSEQTGKAGSKAKQEYYEKQKATLKAHREIDLLGTLEPDVRTRSMQKNEIFAVNASNVANILLLILKIYASVRSGSIAVIASTLDSLLDLLAGAILWFTQLSMRSFDIYKYPIGKARMQPVGIIIFAAVMASLGVQVLIEAVEQLFSHKSTEHMNASQLKWLCSIMGIAIITKLALFLYCRNFKDEIIQAYSKDHYFDVITNATGLAAALLADQFFWWIDPVGAVILAVYTFVNWLQTILENAVSLIGKAAPPEMLQKLTYLVLHHDNAIKRIDTVRAYTFGSCYFVEVDIELPEDMPLREAHHIGESLQNKIEHLSEVERAFVHLDFECEHKPEHSLHFKKFHPDE